MNERQTSKALNLVENELLCPLCGCGGIITSTKTHRFDYGSGDLLTELTMKAPIRRCEPCDFEFLDYEAEKIKHETVCEHLGVLTPMQITDIRKSCHMSRSKFAEITGLGEASLNRWENGINVQSLAYDRYLRLLENPAIMQKLKATVNNLNLQQATNVSENRFRTLKVDDRMREKQEKFQLRAA